MQQYWRKNEQNISSKCKIAQFPATYRRKNCINRTLENGWFDLHNSFTSPDNLISADGLTRNIVECWLFWDINEKIYCKMKTLLYSYLFIVIKLINIVYWKEGNTCYLFVPFSSTKRMTFFILFTILLLDHLLFTFQRRETKYFFKSMYKIVTYALNSSNWVLSSASVERNKGLSWSFIVHCYPLPLFRRQNCHPYFSFTNESEQLPLKGPTFAPRELFHRSESVCVIRVLYSQS